MIIFVLSGGMLAFSAAVSAQGRLETLAGNGSIMLSSPSGEVLTSINPDASLIPASLVKIPLAQVALTTLGEDFHFETHFFTNDSQDLLIRGLGDPFLVSEEIASIADILAGQGLRQVRRLVMDGSAFEANLDLPDESNSDQPYGATNSALAANFNTVNLDWTDNGEPISAESQTPLTPLARELAAGLSPGAAQRINLGSDPRSGLLQVQQLFLYFLEQSGIAVRDTEFYREELSGEWKLFYQHSNSQSLLEILQGLLRYSNNFIANQLFLVIGAQSHAYPASTEGARTALRLHLAELYGDGFGSDPQTLLMLEGSGLSREQRSTAAALMHILDVFKPHADLLPEINGVLRKSGTLTGVYNFAGYLRGDDGLYPFVILTNQAANNRDEILRLLQQRL